MYVPCSAWSWRNPLLAVSVLFLSLNLQRCNRQQHLVLRQNSSTDGSKGKQPFLPPPIKIPSLPTLPVTQSVNLGGWGSDQSQDPLPHSQILAQAVQSTKELFSMEEEGGRVSPSDHPHCCFAWRSQAVNHCSTGSSESGRGQASFFTGRWYDQNCMDFFLTKLQL